VTGKISFDKLGRRRVPSCLLSLADGRVLGSAADGSLITYDPATDELKKLACELPELPGRAEFATLTGAVQVTDGTVYGLTQSGRLFRLDLRTETVTDLGKPFRQNGGKTLVHNPADGLVYGVCGDRFGLDRMFAYDPVAGGFLHLGLFNNRAPYLYEYRYARFGAITVTTAGRIAVGELDNLADIEIWPPQTPDDRQ